MNIISDMKMCTACGACALVCPKNAIQMVVDLQGFLKPVVDSEKCINCKKCIYTCHINFPAVKSRCINSICAYNLKDEVRFTSTSGGVFFELAKAVLNKNGIVIGAAWNKKFQVEHVVVDSIDKINRLQGAKYLQSNLNNTYKITQDALVEGKKVLFSGTPCQIGGLKRYLGKEESGLITIELICHGVPSSVSWEQYRKYIKMQIGTTAKEKQINMRSKNTGWTTYSIEIEYEDGNKYSNKSMDDPYMLAFIHNMTLRSSCLNCNYKGYERIADITLGDCWGIWNVAPEMNDNKGASMVLLNTTKGIEIWKEITNYFYEKNIDLKKIVDDNISLVKSSSAHSMREYILNSLAQDDFNSLLTETKRIQEQRFQQQLLNKKNRSIIRRVIGKVKNIIGE